MAEEKTEGQTGVSQGMSLDIAKLKQMTILELNKVAKDNALLSQ